jgi:hypothetical protein
MTLYGYQLHNANACAAAQDCRAGECRLWLLVALSLAIG